MIYSKTTNNKHTSYGLFSRTTLVRWYQKGRTILDFNEARDDGGDSDIIWTSLQTEKHISTLLLNTLPAA